MVFVITNDLSKEHLGSGSLFGDTQSATLPQGNKALRDEVLHFVTSGIRRAAESAENCVGNPEQQELDINPLNIHDSGINFTAFKGMLTQMMIGGTRVTDARRTRGDSTNRASFGAEAVARMHIPERRALFESENERMVANEVMAASEILADVAEKGGAYSIGSAGSAGMKRSARVSSSKLTRNASTTSASTASYASSALEVSNHDEDTHERSVGSSSRGSTIRITSDYTYDANNASLLPTSHENSTSTSVHSSSLLPTIQDTNVSNESYSQTFLNMASNGSNDADAKKTTFIDYLPKEFAQIRKHFKINNETYIDEWSTAAKVKLNEGGASQAFFFYSGGERFIAKSCTLVK